MTPDACIRDTCHTCITYVISCEFVIESCGFRRESLYHREVMRILTDGNIETL